MTFNVENAVRTYLGIDAKLFVNVFPLVEPFVPGCAHLGVGYFIPSPVHHSLFMSNNIILEDTDATWDQRRFVLRPSWLTTIGKHLSPRIQGNDATFAQSLRSLASVEYGHVMCPEYDAQERLLNAANKEVLAFLDRYGEYPDVRILQNGWTCRFFAFAYGGRVERWDVAWVSPNKLSIDAKEVEPTGTYYFGLVPP